VSKLLAAITPPKSQSTPSSSSSGQAFATSPVGKIFSSITFPSIDEEGDSDGFGDEFSSTPVLALPSSLTSAMGTILYLLEDTLISLTGDLENDTPLTVEKIEM
jgi:hypothetical protein